MEAFKLRLDEALSSLTWLQVSLFTARELELKSLKIPSNTKDSVILLQGLML